MRSLSDQQGSSSGTTITGDAAKRVADLQKLVDTYRTELEGISRDSRALEEQLTQGAGLVKQSLLDEATARISQLENGKCPREKR